MTKMSTTTSLRSARAFIMILAAAGMSFWVPGAWASDARQSAEARQRAEFGRLNELRKDRRATVLRLPGVVGLGTETRDDPKRAVITVYVDEETPELRSKIEAQFPGTPIEIIEKPGGFRAY